MACGPVPRVGPRLGGGGGGRAMNFENDTHRLDLAGRWTRLDSYFFAGVVLVCETTVPAGTKLDPRLFSLSLEESYSTLL